MTILRPATSSKLASLTIRIPSALAADITAVRGAAKEAGREFPVAEICRDALAASIREARKELARLTPPAGSGSGELAEGSQ